MDIVLSIRQSIQLKCQCTGTSDKNYNIQLDHRFRSFKKKKKIVITCNIEDSQKRESGGEIC